MKEFYTAKDLIEILNFSKNTIYKYLEEGKIKSTRVGKGGYRIPRVEVEKWLAGGKLPNESVQVETRTEVVLERVAKDKKARDSEHWLEFSRIAKAKVGLFDWLVFLLTIMVSLALFLLPTYFYQIKFKEVIWLVYVFRGLFLTAGVLYLVFSVNKEEQRGLYLGMNFWLAIMYLILGAVGWWLGEGYGVALYGAMFLVLLARGFKKKTIPIICFIWLIFATSLMMNLGFVFGRLQMTMMEIDKWYLWVLIFSLPFLVLTFCLQAVKEDKKLFHWVMFLQGGIFLWIAMRLVEFGVWDRVFAYMVIGIMAFLFPFEKQFESKVREGEKKLLKVLIYMGVVLMVGGLVMTATRNVFRSMIKDDLFKRSEIIMANTEEFFEYSKEELLVLTKSELLQDLIKNEDGELLDELIKGVVDSSREIQRIGVFNRDGILLSTYPHADPNPEGMDLSLREYFERAKEGKIHVGNLIRLKLAGNPWSVMMGVPVYDSEGEFVGVVSGGVDMERLRNAVEMQQETEEGSVIIFDDNGRVLVDTSGKWLYEEVGHKHKEFLFEGVVTEHFNEDFDSEVDRDLELGIYRELKDSGYGMILEESVEELEERMVEVLLPIVGAMMIVLLGGLGWILGEKSGEGLGKRGDKIGKNWEKGRK